jgi:opacity protein-like surface antigen
VSFACRLFLAGGLLAAIGLTLPASGEAQENRVPNAQEETPGWRFTFTPYLWGTGLHGQVGVAGRSTDVDISVGDVIDNFDIGVMGLVEARKNLWALSADVFFVNLGNTVDGVTVDLSELMLQPELGRTILARPWGGIDALVGARYWHLGVDLSPTEVSQSADWIDAVLGARLRFLPAQRWHLFAKGDLGGGGSKFTWQAYGGAAYDVGRCCALSALYRYLDVDYEKDLTYDVHFNGPALGLTLRF